MGSLAPYLARTMISSLAGAWTGHCEAGVLTPEQITTFGFKKGPACDLLLENKATSQKAWVEFEISRADPVANQVKYAARHIVYPYSARNSFISMSSGHLAPGRKILLQANVHVLRRLGMKAFHMSLLPKASGSEIKRLNNLDSGELDQAGLPIRSELDRLFALIDPQVSHGELDAHYAGDLLEVILNIRNWNLQLKSSRHQAKWGKRTVTFFAAIPDEKLFAPSKFCAYQILSKQSSVHKELPGAMNISDYVRLGEQNPKFDGNLARLHLEKGLGMRLLKRESPEEQTIHEIFANWLQGHEQYIQVHPKGPCFLVPED